MIEYLSKSTSVTLCLTAGTLLSIRSSTNLPMLTRKEFSPVTGTALYWFLYRICNRSHIRGAPFWFLFKSYSFDSTKQLYSVCLKMLSTKIRQTVRRVWIFLLLYLKTSVVESGEDSDSRVNVLQFS